VRECQKSRQRLTRLKKGRKWTRKGGEPGDGKNTEWGRQKGGWPEKRCHPRIWREKDLFHLRQKDGRENPRRANVVGKE